MWVGTLLQTWQKQVRWVAFDGQIETRPVRTGLTHPQGGPWGPAVMQLWTIRGALAAKEKERVARQERWRNKKSQNVRARVRMSIYRHG